MRKLLYAVVALMAVALLGASVFMMNFSLRADARHADVDNAWGQLYQRVPDMQPWVDSLLAEGLLRDTFVVMPTGERHHALFLRADSAHGRTAVVVHGYKDSCVKFLYLGRMYHRDLGYNLLMPDLHGHGLREGNDIQMGWKDRLDVMRWTEVAEQLFRDSLAPSRMVVHGVSMGAATTMCLSGEELPAYVEGFVADCGYTSVWDEFRLQLKEQFSLPAFPLLYTTSLLNRLVHGWWFGEASPIRQVARCHRPMLFIHGDADTFVPYWMMDSLYAAKPCPKEKWTAPGITHARAYQDCPDVYTEKVRAFLESLPPR